MVNTFTVLPGGQPPRRAYKTDAGYDIALRVTVTIKPGETVYIPSGVMFTLEPNYCVSVMPRSSSFKYGIIITPTIIDCNYTGEISTVATNITQHPVTLKAGIRVAQCKLDKVYLFDNDNQSLIYDNARKRGDKGIGSTGVR